jgi:hypothetical protein
VEKVDLETGQGIEDLGHLGTAPGRLLISTIGTFVDEHGSSFRGVVLTRKIVQMALLTWPAGAMPGPPPERQGSHLSSGALWRQKGCSA